MCIKEVVQPYKSDREGGKVLEGRVWIKDGKTKNAERNCKTEIKVKQ